MSTITTDEIVKAEVAYGYTKRDADGAIKISFNNDAEFWHDYPGELVRKLRRMADRIERMGIPKRGSV